MSDLQETRVEEQPANSFFRILPWLVLPLLPAIILFVYFAEIGKIV